MEWSDEGIVIGHRAHGETGVVAEVFTRAHGRCLGFVHGGRSRKLRPVLQVGNCVQVTWRARLADNLGHFSLELAQGFAAELMAHPAGLSAISTMAEHVRLLPERDPHPNLFEITHFVLSYLDDDSVWPALFVRWELALLQEFGAGLDFSQCAATGRTDGLIYVSPKSGRAVSREAGAPYADRLFELPPFLRPGDNRRTELADVLGALRMTAHFLETRVLADVGRNLPEPRARMIRALERQMADRRSEPEAASGSANVDNVVRLER